VFQTQFIQAVRILIKMQVVEICNIYLKPVFINMHLKITDMENDAVQLGRQVLTSHRVHALCII